MKQLVRTLYCPSKVAPRPGAGMNINLSLPPPAPVPADPAAAAPTLTPAQALAKAQALPQLSATFINADSEAVGFFEPGKSYKITFEELADE